MLAMVWQDHWIITKKITHLALGWWCYEVVVETTKDNSIKDYLYMWGDSREEELGLGNIGSDVLNSIEVTKSYFDIPLIQKNSLTYTRGFLILKWLQKLPLMTGYGKAHIYEEMILMTFQLWMEKENYWEYHLTTSEKIMTITNPDKLVYIITDSILGLIFIIAIVISGVFYNLYGKEKIKKQ